MSHPRNNTQIIEYPLDHGISFPILSPVAFFDLDLTILSVNSATLWVKQEFQGHRLSTWDLCRAFYWLTLYHFGAHSLEPALLSAIQSLRGQEIEDFNARVLELFQRRLVNTIRPKAREQIRWQVRLGI